MIRTKTEIDLVEIDGSREPTVAIGKKRVLVIESHPNGSAMHAQLIVLRFGEQSWTVEAQDLAAAIRNVTGRS